MTSLTSASAETALSREETMLGHVLVRPGELELRELPRPQPDPGEVVLRVGAALTCGTDLKTFLRGHPKFAMPMLFGHEFSGIVADVGRGVRGFREGDAVMAAPTAPCGSCYYCERDQENLCAQVMETMVHGAYAEYVRLPASVVETNLYHKPARLSFEEAALLEPLSCVLHGLSQLKLRTDDTAVLIGGGGITLLHLLALRARGVERVVVVARNAGRAAVFRGRATELIVEDAGRAVHKILELTSGRGADVVIECTGNIEVWEAAVGLARPGGQVVLFGGCPSGTEARFDTARLHYDQVRVLSPFHFAPRDVRSAYELLGDERFDGSSLIARPYPLSELAIALERLRVGEGPKFAIIPNGA